MDIAVAEDRRPEQFSGDPGAFDVPTTAQFRVPEANMVAAAWEEVTPGRYQPRRFKGSCQGRALG